jgi:hypothetical protein
MNTIKRAKKVKTVFLSQGLILKIRLLPWIHTKDGYIWLASMAVGKSIRQINDWMNRRKNGRVRQLNTSLTGKFGVKPQLIAICQVRKWIEELPDGDAICLRCESAKANKQFDIWQKWFRKNEDPSWVISEEHMSFYYYKNKV